MDEGEEQQELQREIMRYRMTSATLPTRSRLGSCTTSSRN